MEQCQIALGSIFAFYSDNDVTIMLEEWNLHESQNNKSGIKMLLASDPGLITEQEQKYK